MYLSKALKARKKAITKVARSFEKFEKHNSHKETLTPTYDPAVSHAEWKKATEELTILKTQIITATAPIYGKIFEMAEAKNQISQLRQIATFSGLKKDGYSNDSTEIMYVAFMNEISKDLEIDRLEELIDTLQSEIEAFNSITHI